MVALSPDFSDNRRQRNARSNQKKYVHTYVEKCERLTCHDQSVQTKTTSRIASSLNSANEAMNLRMLHWGCMTPSSKKPNLVHLRLVPKSPLHVKYILTSRYDALAGPRCT